jgi:hypothetical protein
MERAMDGDGDGVALEFRRTARVGYMRAEIFSFYISTFFSPSLKSSVSTRTVYLFCYFFSFSLCFSLCKIKHVPGILGWGFQMFLLQWHPSMDSLIIQVNEVC